MKLPGLAIPEFEKLPAEGRASFLLRCDESEEMRRCRSQTQVMAKLCLLCVIVIPILLGKFVFHWSIELTVCSTVVLALSSFGAFFYFCMVWRIRIMRRQLITELKGLR